MIRHLVILLLVAGGLVFGLVQVGGVGFSAIEGAVAQARPAGRPGVRPDAPPPVTDPEPAAPGADPCRADAPAVRPVAAPVRPVPPPVALPRPRLGQAVGELVLERGRPEREEHHHGYRYLTYPDLRIVAHAGAVIGWAER